MPNYGAQRQAKEQVASNDEYVNAMSGALKQRALKKNTLDTNGSVVGYVYFDRQKKGPLLVRITLGETVFEFPFDAKTRE